MHSVFDDIEDETVWYLALYLYDTYTLEELYAQYKRRGNRDGSVCRPLNAFIKHTATEYREALNYALIEYAFTAKADLIDFMRKEAFPSSSPKKG